MQYLQLSFLVLVCCVQETNRGTATVEKDEEEVVVHHLSSTLGTGSTHAATENTAGRAGNADAEEMKIKPLRQSITHEMEKSVSVLIMGVVSVYL